jgi:predicted secreted protein
MSNAISGVGTVFSRSDMATPTPAFTAVAEINGITGPGMTRETIDVTSLDSTGGYREFIAGFRDAGTIVLNMNFTAAGFLAFKADFEADTPVDYKIVMPDTDDTTFSFSGLVTELPVEIPKDDKVTMNVTIKISGQVTMS